MSTRELYEILGLQPFADGATVDQAYWHLAKAYQAEAPQDPRARIALDELNDAYAVLGTPRLREEYDATLRTASIPSDSRPAIRQRKLELPRLFRRRSSPATVATAPVQPANATPFKSKVERKSRTTVEGLRSSTDEMLRRWRASAGVEATKGAQPNVSEPDTTLVDIFRSEDSLRDEQDPLNAVMDVLRAKNPTAPVK